MSAIMVGGDIVHYEVLGRGRPAVLVHGWVGSWRYWIPTMQLLHLKYRVYAIDLFGFGDSAKNPEKYTLDYQLTLLEEFMNQLGLSKAALIGHGLGAYVVTAFAGRHPEMVPRMLIASAPLFDPGDLATRGQRVLLNKPKTADDPPAPRPLNPLKTADSPAGISGAGSTPGASGAAGKIDATVVRRPDLHSLPNGEATIRSASSIDRSRLEAAALARSTAEIEKTQTSKTPDSRPSESDKPFTPTSTFPATPIERKDETPLLRPAELQGELKMGGLSAAGAGAGTAAAGSAGASGSPEIPAASNISPTDNPLYGRVGRFDGAALLQRCFKKTEPEFGKLSQDVSKQDDRAIQAIARNFDAGDLLDTLRSLPMPVVVVHGVDDPVIEVPNENVWTYITASKEDSLLPIPLPGVRHFPMLEASAFPRLVTDFLDAPDVSKLEIKEIWRRRSR